ncbi:2,3-bisphosphoglycerate-independent phosphoglycerate mutase [bacterium]|nr:2,3-bisphosphoglycerate-independent phosphoglycerate mutase [bacterium]
MRPKPVVLVVLDGYGIKPPSKANAITQAVKPNLDKWYTTYPVMLLQAAGESVGLNWGEMGNSEVGHLSLGSGRIIYQSLPRITRSITDGKFFKNQKFIKAVKNCKDNDSALHLMGLVSPGGVHSHSDHLYALLEIAKSYKLNKVFVHVFLDGRDTEYNSGSRYVKELETKMKEIGVGKIATISGRYFAMDRDNNWDRIAKTFNALVMGESKETYATATKAIETSYNNKVYDEQFEPIVLTKKNEPVAKVNYKDSLIFFNFRSDRARELAKSFILPGFSKFERPDYFKNLYFVAMTEYEKDLPLNIAYPPKVITKSLGKVIADADLKQFHIAETEKYAHVTFFFNGGSEEAFSGEERAIIPSPKVISYDEKPEMSAPEVTSRLIKEIESDKHDFIVVNFANSDMVGHTGNLNATIKSIETLDNLIGQIVEAVQVKNGVTLITSDHGNAENLFNLQSGEIAKEHSKNPVPLYIIGNDFKDKIVSGTAGKEIYELTASGVLADVAPTILKIMGLKKPTEMTGRSLI